MPHKYPGVAYILPIRTTVPRIDSDFREYLEFVSALTETIVVDGSDDAVFAVHARTWGRNVVHVRPDADLATPMGKVGGVLTGMRIANHDKVIIADDDIRYDEAGIVSVANALDSAQVVRPQNYFAPLPWHALWDSGRSLLNRTSGGDWPGTLGVLREPILRAGGYDGTAMFENLELVRTVLASGGCERILLDTFVARRPSTARHFFSQRVRQAYDEFARPARLIFQLALLPAAIVATASLGWRALAFGALAIIILAEIGRQRGKATRVFPFVAALAAPLWVAERALCVWLAVAARFFFGGVRYRGVILQKAATPLSELKARAAAGQASRISMSMGLNDPLLDNSAEHAVTPTIISISARSTM